MPKFPPIGSPRSWNPAKQSGVDSIIMPPSKNRWLLCFFTGIVALVATVGVLLSWLTPAPQATPNVALLVDKGPKQAVVAEETPEEIKILNPREVEPEVKPPGNSLSGRAGRPWGACAGSRRLVDDVARRDPVDVPAQAERPVPQRQGARRRGRRRDVQPDS